MSLPLKRTLGEMRAELQTRLGFGMSGQAGIVNSPIMDSFLRSAQDQLYETYDWRELCTFEERLTGVDQAFYDYPDDCNIERINLVAIWDGGRWCELDEGISIQDRSVDVLDRPLKFERFEQMEVWPVPRAQFRMRREYVKTLQPFSESNHRSSIPSEIVFLMALSNAKAHYKQADAERYEKQLDALLNKLKARHRGKSVWTKEDAHRRTDKDDYYSYPR